MSNTHKILLVEDEPNIIDLYSIVLKKAGYNFKIAVDGNQGLQEILNYQPDLVFLDIMLPGITGLDILRAVRQDPLYANVKTKIVILTNLADEDILKQIGELKADGYILKVNISPPDLIETIEALLDKPAKAN
jgi:CheY-like chemotaxis protein